MSGPEHDHSHAPETASPQPEETQAALAEVRDDVEATTTGARQGLFSEVLEQAEALIEDVTETITNLITNSGVEEFLDDLIAQIDSFLGGSSAVVASESISTYVPRGQSMDSEMGDIVETGGEDPFNLFEIPESISLPEYSSSAEPLQWYSTPRGPCWLERSDRGDVLIQASKMRFFYRDRAFNSRQFDTVEDYLNNTLEYVRLNDDGTLSILEEDDSSDPRIARIHPEYTRRFQLAWQEIYDAGIRYEIHSLSTFRFMGTSRESYPYMSQHAMGISIDFNPGRNGWEAGITPDYGVEFMRIMARHGFRPPITWGTHEDGHDHGDGHDHDFTSMNADWMHFDMVPDEHGLLRDNYTDELEEELEHFE